MFTRKLTSDHKVIVISALVLFLSFYFTLFAYSTTCNFTIKGDTNKDDTVNASDLFPIAQLYGLTSSSPSGFDCVVDTNEDGKIDASDLFPVAQNYGMKASGTTISGTVTAPSGVSLGRVEDRTANASGLTAAANVQVQAYQVDDSGNKTGNTLATANTDTSGNYILTLPSSITIASNIIVSVGSGDNQMRAIVTGTTEAININPITELVTKKIVESPASLTEFTTEEVKNIKTEVETAATSVNFSTTNTVSAAVATLYIGSIATTLDTVITQAGGINHNPVITSTAITTATVGQAYSYTITATDADGDTLTYSLTTYPTGMTINSTTDVITWTPTAAGQYNVTVSVSDGKGGAVTQSSTITVSPPSSDLPAKNLVGKLAGGIPQKVQVVGNYAYIAADGILSIVDISNPASPHQVGYYDTPGKAMGVYVSGSYAYVADWEKGLRIINISNPTVPTEAGYYDTPWEAADVYVSGNYAYVADRHKGLRIINISDKAFPIEVGYYEAKHIIEQINTRGDELEFWEYYVGVYVSGNYAYITNLSDGLRIIDISNPESPRGVGYYRTGDAEDVYVSGNYAYVADSGSGLRIINISNPATPTEIGYYDTPGMARGVYVSGNYAYVADQGSGLWIFGK